MPEPLDPEHLLDIMREERATDDGEVLASFYINTISPTGEDAVTIAPCIEPPMVTAYLMKQQLHAEGMRVQWVIFACDTYRFTDETLPALDVDFDALFKAGDPRVTEALVVTLVELDGPGWYYTQSYIAKDGAFVWGPVESVADDQPGLAHASALRIKLEEML